MNKEYKEVKRKLIRARDIVRRKYKILKHGRAALQTLREESAEPIIRPLKELSASLIERSNNMETTMNGGEVTKKNETTLLMNNNLPTTIGMQQRNEEPQTSTVSTDVEMQVRDDPVARQIEFDQELDETFTFVPDTESTQIGSHSFPRSKRKMTRRYTESDVGSPTLFQASNTPEGKKFINKQLEQVNKHARPYIKWLLTKDNSGLAMDKTYGPRIMTNGKMYLGDSEFNMDLHSIYVKGQQYPGTKGLYDLIFLYNPPEQSNSYDESDLEMYREIVNNTNLARRGFVKTGHLNGSGKKYQKLIKDLVHKESSGKGLFNLNTEQSIQYIPWNDPNELVDRLKLLISSQQAGNLSHNNEINAIIKELLEEGLISA